jgi:molybdate transport system substrate-binding protein
MPYLSRLTVSFSFICLQLLSSQVQATEIRVAVASNFLQPLQTLARAYEQTSGDKIIISAGSTGKLYAQIINGAPFDIFLAANSSEPEKLEKEGFAVSGSRFTYARGRLVLWNPKGVNPQRTLQAVLQAADFNRLSLANPVTAPYGAAAISVLQKFNLEQSLSGKLLRGENISQAYQYVASGAADLGFIALSQIKTGNGEPPGAYWLVDESLHAPIVQQAVLIKSSAHPKQAQAFLNYLQGGQGKAMIEKFGYGLP